MGVVEDVEAFVKEEGAVTEAQVMKAFELSKPAARSLLAKMVLHERIVWIPVLPRQARVWFALPENEQGFALPLKRGSSGGRGTSKAMTEMMDRILTELELDEWTIPELVDLYEAPRHQVYRAVHRLEAQGRVVSRTWHDVDAGRGRPPLLWRAAGTEPTRVSVDSARERRRARRVRDEGDEEQVTQSDDDWRSVVSFDDG